ncbi:retrovirus-related Pol polyprotein from transposon 412 [Trichonephila clavipes]|nr:retrovirus-related Pol polyprotein from transposon 412 [Trichonephila clavipes]
MSGEIAEFVQTCKGCQLRKPEKIGDRAPITPIVRPELPFEIVNIDVIGPIQPPSGRGHKYVLCMMDQHTRWPEAVPLRSLTAKNACDSLLQIFSRTGIPSIIASDQGTNFRSALTQEFTKRIGSSPRFSCPGYPTSNGLVERWNKVLKDMIHQVIREDPQSWDRQLPFLLFAYREVPNTTTGVSPFRLLYGREARGPLAILKSSWAGEIYLPTNISQSAADYLQEMKINMEKAAESASLTAAQKQKAYGDYFNKKSSVKNFSIGEQVVLLIPDSSNKIYARWTGPGEIIQHHPPHSYKVKLSDGTVRHVHVNKIRKYHPRALAVGVIFEGDYEFGEIHPTPNLSRSTSERVLHEINLNHLKETVRIYRIPESLKIKVDEQIEELLRLDLIEEFDAEIAYPIVCVNKKNGTLRLCVDFRALNSESVSDDFPMEDAVELIHSIGKANIITTIS